MKPPLPHEREERPTSSFNPRAERLVGQEQPAVRLCP